MQKVLSQVNRGVNFICPFIGQGLSITSILQTYVDKKTDGAVIVGEKEINCLLIVQQINDKLGQN